MYAWLRYPQKMDFDPNGVKWQCCCCQLPAGLQALAVAELVLTTAVAVGTVVKIAGDTQPPTAFEICLVPLMLLTFVTSALLIIGIQRHVYKLLYPSIFTRGLLIVFVQVFGVSTVFSPHHDPVRQPGHEWSNSGVPPPPATSVALRLVLLVFAMLFLTVLVVYICYLIVRGINYEKAFARRKQRRDSLITAGMIDPDFGSRRPSNT